MIARIYGIFSIKTEYFKSIDIIIMQNTSVLFQSKSSKLTFDLKGSSVNRLKKINIEHLIRKKYKNSPILKDTNFLMMQGFLRKDVINLDNNKKKQIFESLRKDSQFLCS